MSVSKLIEEILSEWAYRVNDGMPNPKNPTHLKELGIVLSEMGLSHIKNELVENLLTEKGKTPEPVKEEEKSFSNPVLNKKVTYKDKEGNDKEGIVGNLLRQPVGTPARDAAEKVLPPEGSPERDALNQELGGEGGKKGKEGPEDAQAKADAEKEKQQQAQAMFDPKVDPAMAVRLDKEKETLAQIAKDAEKASAEADKEVQPEKEEDGFNPIPTQDVQKEIPQADPETFGGDTDIPDGVEQEDLKKFNTDISKVQQMVADAKAKGEPAPNINLCQITVPGTNLYCDDNLGIPRAEMPQFKGKAQPGSKAADMPVDKSGEVDTEPVFREMLKQKNIKVTQTEVPADKLKATQSELVGAKVVGMMGALEENPEHPAITAPIYVSRDGYVIDGHHRWAAVAAYNAKHPEKQIPMKVQVIDQDIKDAIPMANKFAEDMGIAAKKADANKETSTEKSPIVDKLKQRKTSEGEELDAETTQNGSMIIGVEHGEGTESTKETINQITSLPKDTKVMFVGEGGMSKDDAGNIEFSGEQAEIRDAVKGHFDNAEESSWDENANVYDDNSPVFDEVANSLGGSKSKSKAAIWSNMVGQGDDMNADDYLDDEGKAWLVAQAKKGGSGEFDGEVDWNNLTDVQRDDLYQLNFRDDENYGETEISKAQEAYNGFRQKELDRKIKEAESKGYKVIAPVGNSHVDMWRKRNKSTDTSANASTTTQSSQQPKKVSSFTKMTDAIKNKISNWQKEEKEFFEKGYYKAGSEPRRTLSQAIKDKAKGAWKAIKKGAKHEIEEFKEAGIGAAKFFSGKELSSHEKKALKAVGIKIATTAIFGAAMGGLSYGAAGFAKHVAIEFIPHVVGETILKGAGRAALFADTEGEAEIEANMQKFAELIAKGLEDMDISEEQMEEMVDSYNKKKEKGEINNMETPQMKEELLPLVDEMIGQLIEGFIEEVGPETKFSAKSKETGKIVYFKTQQAKDDALKAGTHEDPKKRADEPDTKEKPTQNIFTTDPSYQQRLDKEKDITQKDEPKIDTPTFKQVPVKPSKKDGEAAMRSTANRAQSFKTRVVKNLFKKKLDNAIGKDVRGFSASDFKTVPGEVSVPSKEFSGFYHRGGGYYSQTPDGPITHVLKKMVESVNEAPKPKQSKVKKADLVPIASLNLNPSQKAAVTKVANQAKKEISELPSPTNEKTKKEYRDKTKKSVTDSLKLKKSDVAKKEAEEKAKLAADIKAWEKGGKKGPKPKKKSKGVGLGSPDSRAGESAVVLGSIRIHELIKQGKSYQQARQIVEQELMKYVGPDTYLTKSWVKSALNTLDLLEREVGFKNIAEFGWDNPEGRALVGSQGHGTSSDMFIRTKDGKRIGVSLKKDLKVFVFNGGYTEMSENLKERGFSFSEKSSPEHYVQRRAEEFERGKKDLIKNKNATCKAWENIKKNPGQTFDPLDKRVGHILKKTGKKNLKSVSCDDFINNILSDTGGDTMKMLSQFYQHPDVEAITPAYKRLRGLDKELTDEIAKDFSKPENEKLVKDLVRDETHISDILFSDNPNLDELKVVYGTEPAIEMKKEKLVQLFGIDKLYAKYEKETDPKKKEALKKKIEEEINKKITVSTKGGVMSIAINVTDSTGKQSVIPLFEAKIRTRGIGAAPTFEMAQNTFGGLSFKYGTSDFTKWDEKDRKVVVLSTLNDLEEEFGEELQHLDKKTLAEIGIRLQELEKISPNSKEVQKFREKYLSKAKK